MPDDSLRDLRCLRELGARRRPGRTGARLAALRGMKRSQVMSLGAALGAVVLARGLLRRWTAYDVRDKVALITGGSRGLGLVIARELAVQGAKVAICARRRDELERARHELVQRGCEVFA